jgi:cellulose synthase operon protein C
MSNQEPNGSDYPALRLPMPLWVRLLAVLVAVVGSITVSVLVANAVKRRTQAASPDQTPGSSAGTLAEAGGEPSSDSSDAALSPELAEEAAAAERAELLDSLLAEGGILLTEKRAAQAVSAFREASAHSPDSAPAWLGLIAACRQAGDFTQAWRACESALASVTGEQVEIHRAFAHLARDCGRADTALAETTKVLAHLPDDADAHFVAASALLTLGPKGSALKHARKAVEGAPESHAAQVMLGRALTAADQPTAAVEVLRRALAEVPGSPRACLALAHTQRQLGDDEGARKTLAEIDESLVEEETRLVEILLDPGGELPPAALGSDRAIAAMAAVERAELLLRGGKGREAMAEFRRLAAEYPDLPSIHYRFAELTLLSGQVEAARKLAETQLARSSEDTRGHVILARVFLNKGLFGLAKEECRKALGGNLSRRAALSARQTLAVAYNRSGDPKQAIAEIQGCLEARPDNQEAIICLSIFQLAAGDAQAAIDTLRAAAERFPDAPRFPTHEAALLLRNGDRKGAIVATRKAIEVGAKGGRSHLRLTTLLLAEDQAAEALPFARLARERMPRSHLAADTLAWCLILNDKLDEALPHVRFALGAMPSAPRYLYHHAVLLKRQQKTEEAVGELRTALASTRQFAEREAAEKLLATLGDKKP